MLTLSAILAIAAILTVAMPTGAHVVVSPSEVSAGSSVTFEMRVPTEEDVPATRSQLAIPDDVTVSGVEPVAGWRIKLERSGDRIVGISARGRLQPGFFQRFYFRARMPQAATVLVWKAIQTYRNGKVARYTDEPGEETASRTTVVVPPAAAAR